MYVMYHVNIIILNLLAYEVLLIDNPFNSPPVQEIAQILSQSEHSYWHQYTSLPQIHHDFFDLYLGDIVIPADPATCAKNHDFY